MRLELGKKDALILVDVQRDFCPGGALPVPNGDRIIPILNRYVELFNKAGAQIYATRDWHPPDHTSFKPYGGSWPPHCIRGSKGAEFHTGLTLPSTSKVVSITETHKNAYSGFDGTELEKELKKKMVRRVFVGGLATDYCVKHTVLDAIRLGFETIILLDATLGVNLKLDDSKRAIEQMIRKGAKKITLPELATIENLETTDSHEKTEENHFKEAEEKKKARLRTRGPYRKATYT